MTNRVSIIIGDVIRWIIALILLPIIIWVLFLFFMFPFEWLLMKTTNWWLFFHISFWFIIGNFIIGFTMAIGGLISTLSVFLVRQSIIYTVLFTIGIIGLVIFCILGAWIESIQFSWEQLRFGTFNKILFTVLILQLLQIPFAMFLNESEQDY